jgi:hypothetical protein
MMIMSRYNTMSVQLPSHERLVVLLDDYPWIAFCRVGEGYVMLSLVSLACGNDYHGWCVIGVFLGALLTLRLVPVVLRRCLPFSSEVRAIWAERRQLTKRFDSYQWQKVFWLGVGMASNAIMSAKVSEMVVALIAFCLTAGGLGILSWRRRAVGSPRQVDVGLS